MLNAQAPAKNLRRNQVRNNSGRKRPGKGLRIGCDKWRESPSSEKAFAGPVRGIQKTRAPRSARGDLASESRIIFKLTLPLATALNAWLFASRGVPKYSYRRPKLRVS